MKTYLYATYSDEGIIELVRKNEHDAVVRELNERLTKQQSNMLDTIVQRQLEITKWQSMAESLATALKTCQDFIEDAHIIEAQWGWEPVKEAEKTLAAYESAKKGEQP